MRLVWRQISPRSVHWIPFRVSNLFEEHAAHTFHFHVYLQRSGDYAVRFYSLASDGRPCSLAARLRPDRITLGNVTRVGDDLCTSPDWAPDVASDSQCLLTLSPWSVDLRK
jgi:hypothetical protein